ncbi:hypothetical protein KOI35_46665 [Actinoplanes bogorensis]|uniref:N-acetyltransferase domain-containing protein n=1 Tax=Paractinoplanes bogorensis TaxID=1610840 RepID=A0ABS5Z5P0_9ACTN|nr:hypothetical protein [Actinoplanes bogorensis]MBU2671005.1 hypothetical protein [Actinoplanes bogorensis]
MRVDATPALPDCLLDAAWEFYRDTFDELRVLAVNRHMLYRHEFEELMADKRNDKYVVQDDEGVVGLAVMTTDLHAAPLISPDYFRHHWPTRYAENNLFFVHFVGVRQGSRGRGVFIKLMREMYKPVEAADGLVFIDVCTYNEDVHELPEMIGKVLDRIAGHAVSTRIDSQSFWMYEFPKSPVPAG